MAVTMSGSASGTSVRCSTCNVELDYGRMADHVCPLGTPLHMPKPSTPVIDRFNNFSPAPGSQRSTPLPGRLPKFAPPVRIDPFAANEAFLSPPQTAPGMQPEMGIGSPARAGSPASSRFRMPPRSATTPHFRDRSPSPDMRISQDSAFPVFPTKKVRQEKAKKSQKRSKSMSRSQSRDRGAIRAALGANNQSTPRSASPAPSQFPPRPSTASSSSRKNSLSGSRSPGEQTPLTGLSEPVPPIPAYHDAGGRASPRSESQPSSFAEPPSLAPSPLAGQTSTAEIPLPLNLREQRPSGDSMQFKQPSIPAAIKPLDAIGSTRKVQQELGLNIPRRQSTSASDSGRLQAYSPPASQNQSALVDRRPPEWMNGPSVPEALAIRPPPAAHEMNHDDNDAPEDRLGNLPSFKSPETTVQNHLNRKRTSASSDGSSYSATHSISSRSSPPTSASSFTMQDGGLKGEHGDNPLGEIPERTKSPSSLEPSASAVTSPHRPPQTRTRGPAKSFSRPNYARPQIDTQVAANAPQASLASPRFGPTGMTPPSGPSTPHNRQSPAGPDSRSPLTELRTQLSELRTQYTSPADRSFSPMSPRAPPTPLATRNGENGFQPPRRPTTPGFKGNCRGCGEMIVGKSVSSADGRLTGRYHKQCFVCQTCKEPFQTADFYVINNHPYCQRHYHSLNGSLCNNCDRGIEGPYMETDARKKFHPHCFTCKECHLILRNDYFELNGVIYCEKHSRKPDLLGPGRRFPERRTTRLMMM